MGRLQARLAEAETRLHKFRVRVETLVERYNGERVKLERAREAHVDARRRVAEASRAVAAVREEVGRLAAEQYRSRAGLGEMAAVVAGRGGVSGFLDRASSVHALSHERAATLDRLRSAQIVAEVLEHQAAGALAERRAATERVAEARRAAEAAVREHRAAIERIEDRKRRLEADLAEARRAADEVAEAREAALARAREETARRSEAASDISYGEGGAPAEKGEAAARAALRWLHTPYSWGGGDPDGPTYGIAHGADIRGFDCSGLTMYAWAQAGVLLDHWTGSQWTSGPHVPLDQLRPGDLLFFGRLTDDPATIHHVGLYIGDGRMVEAPYTGGAVRISGIWRSDLVGATRPGG